MSCTCGCCGGTRTHTPAHIVNPPEQDTLYYRLGTHGAFRESMLARLSSRPELAPLTTRADDDASIALLDCFAVIGDVLTFYQERIANEGYLRTARDHQSLAELGRLVGYRPRPALGASTYLAYTLDPGARTTIPVGSGAKSVPRQDQLPQTFETSETLDAREEWNALQPAMTSPPALTYYGPDEDRAAEPHNVLAVAEISIGGTTPNLRPGDRLLFLFGSEHDALDERNRRGAAVRVVRDATPDFAAGTTRIALITDRTPFTTALEELHRRVADASAGAGQAVEAVVRTHLEQLRNRLETDPPTSAEIFVNVLAPHGSVSLPEVAATLIEARAIAAVHAPPAVVNWYVTDVAAVLEAADRVIGLAESLERRPPGELAATRNLARATLCPSSESRRGDTGCDDGVALAALIPILPWLRRPPSRPPRSSRDVNPALAELFRPDSDVHAKMLAAADPVLTQHLHSAWANEVVSPPTALSGAQVLRTKAKVAVASDTETVFLDGIYDTILAGTWVVIDADIVRRVVSVRQESRTETVGDAQVTIPSTVLVLDDQVQIGSGTALFGQGENLTVTGEPRTDDVAGGEIELDRLYEGLQPGRWLVVSGERTDVPHASGIDAAELTMIAAVRQRVDADSPGSMVRTFLVLSGELAYRYRRDSVTIYGNVVAATQGETRNEILGSGDAGVPSPSFAIRQVNRDNPIVALPASNPAGFVDALDVSVSSVRWAATEVLADETSTDRVYHAVVGADQMITIHFGDGVHGARPQTGTGNITATFRIGGGAAGNVVAGQITELTGRPLGVGSVLNPLAASGGTVGDDAATARASTPLAMLALDRIVSLRDYEDLTRSRAGIAKAKACELFDGIRQVVHVTIAALGDAPVDTLSGLFTALEDTLVDHGDRGAAVQVDIRALTLLVIRAGIKIHPDHSWDVVEPAVRAALLDTFSFARRDLAQDAYLSEAIAVAQSVHGVDYVDVDVFQGVPQSVTPIDLLTLADSLTRPDRVVRARPARFVTDTVTVSDGETLSDVALREGRTVDELCRLNPQLTSTDLDQVSTLVMFRGIRPAEIVVLNAAVPETLTLRRIP